MMVTITIVLLVILSSSPSPYRSCNKAVYIAGPDKERVTAEARYFSFPWSAQTGSGTHPASCSVRNRKISPGVKRLMSKANLPVTSTKARNEWSLPSIPNISSFCEEERFYLDHLLYHSEFQSRLPPTSCTVLTSRRSKFIFFLSPHLLLSLPSSACSYSLSYSPLYSLSINLYTSYVRILLSRFFIQFLVTLMKVLYVERNLRESIMWNGIWSYKNLWMKIKKPATQLRCPP